jgi:predicted cupin superfamily sugar epimerase
LDLQPLPAEGGYYRETYRSSTQLHANACTPSLPMPKSAATAIYYLLTHNTVSALHRLPTDEIFHFYLGHPVRMLQLFPDGSAMEIILGPDIQSGQHPQIVVPARVWQGCLLEPGGTVALMGTTMAPGFDFADYEAGSRADLVDRYPAQAELIVRLTS